MISAIDPTCGSMDGGTPVTLSGADLGTRGVDHYLVKFELDDGTEGWVNVDKEKATDTTLEFDTPEMGSVGIADVSLWKYCSEKKSHDPVTLTDAFEFVDVRRPEITSATPNDLVCNTGGARIIVEGMNLDGTTRVFFEHNGGTTEAVSVSDEYEMVGGELRPTGNLIVMTPAAEATAIEDGRIYPLNIVVGEDDMECARETGKGVPFGFDQKKCSDDVPIEESGDPREASGDVVEGPAVVEIGDVLGAPDEEINDVVAAGDGQLVVFVGDDAGGLVAEPAVTVTGEASDLELADLDGDGYLDAIVALEDENRVAVFMNSEKTGFNAARVDTFDVGASPVAVKAAQLFGDASVDLVVGCAGDGTLSLLRGKGDGTFEAAVSESVRATGSATPDVSALAVADFDGDTKIDIAVGTGTTARVEVALNRSSGDTFVADWWASSFTTPSGYQIIAMDTADFAGDGLPDLAVLCGTAADGRALDLYTAVPAASGGPFSSAASTASSVALGTVSNPVDVRFGSFLGAGSELDLAIAFRENVVQVLAGPGYAVAFGERVSVPDWPSITGMAAGVLDRSDGDDAMDLALGGGQRAKTIKLLINDGSGFD